MDITFRNCFASILSLAIFLSCYQVSMADLATYDPNLGTTPDAQGFYVIESGSPPASVSGGILFQGLTSYNGGQFWGNESLAFNFDSGFSLDTTLKVISSTYLSSGSNNGNGQRAGWTAYATDGGGRVLGLGISDNSVFLTTDYGSDGNGITIPNFNTTDAFHSYRVSIAQGFVSLFIDNALRGVTPVGSSNLPPFSVGPTYQVWFGDGTVGGQSQTELKSFRYANVASVPEPTSVILAGSALCLMGVRTITRCTWRRKR